MLIPVLRAAPRPSTITVFTASTRELPQPAPMTSSARVKPAPRITLGEPSRSIPASAARRWAVRAESALPRMWFAVSALLLLFALHSYARLERQSAAWRRMEIDGRCVAISTNCGPGVFGFWRPRIVIPRWALSLEAEARALMLRHEAEHLRARDAQCLLMATVIALLFPWNAAIWLIVKRLRLAIELDCDDRVLRAQPDPRAYGSLLLAVCARRTREIPFAVALAERSSMLERRIRAMTTDTPRRRVLASTPLLLAVLVLSIAAARIPGPRPPGLSPHSARPLPRLTVPESLPPISANWENASLENVIDAFATFSHRRITTAAGVGGLVTATVVSQPWPQALTFIMARLGLRVEFRADSSIYISPFAEAQPRSPQSNEPRSLNVLSTTHGVSCQSLPSVAGADTAPRFEVPLDTLRALSRRLYPGAYSDALRDSAVTIALLFDGRCQLVDHVMGRRSTDSLTVDSAFTLLMPSLRRHHFRSGGIMQLSEARPRRPWLVWAVLGTEFGPSAGDRENGLLRDDQNPMAWFFGPPASTTRSTM